VEVGIPVRFEIREVDFSLPASKRRQKGPAPTGAVAAVGGGGGGAPGIATATAAAIASPEEPTAPLLSIKARSNEEESKCHVG